ncbi:MAG: 2,3-diaminopropionate biosynthesis protein SbnB, partial [Actinomycetota bacterium]|nr:2,3-diaminopropionate biosynthesis protein SbnB [Actinomycetota bacterium]
SKGAFASPVDFDSYWMGNALKSSDKISTGDSSQMEYYRKQGYFKETPVPYADLGDIVMGKKPARENDNERIICINLGIALEDIAVAPIIYKKALDLGIGTYLPL